MRIVGDSASVKGVGRRTSSIEDIQAFVRRVAVALEEGDFDPARAGEVFLAADAERAIQVALGPTVTVNVSRDGRLAVPSLLGLRVTPSLIVIRGATPSSVEVGEASNSDGPPDHEMDEAGKGVVRVAVTITVLKHDARPVQGAIADAVLLAVEFPAVVMVILDRRLEKRDPFGGPSFERQELSVADRRVVEVLRQRHGISVVMRRQDPFGWS